MKKALMVLLVLFTSFLIPNYKVSALSDSFYVGEYLTGEYIVKINESSGKYEQMRAFRRKSDNRVAYCLELWEGINENKTLTGYDSEQSSHANIKYYNWERIMLISYYGYGYENHTDKKWIAITQFMIWKELSPESTLYFTDTLNGKKITKYESEMNEINELVKKHSTLPSFYGKNFEVKYKENYQIVDTNNILDKFTITSYTTESAIKKDNTLTVKVKNIGTNNQVILTNTDKKYNNKPTVYIDENGQDLLITGSYYPIYAIARFNLPESNIKVTKLDEDTNDKIPQGEGSLKGAVLQLLDKNKEVVSEKKITDDSDLTFEHVGYGTYYIKEVKAGTGYLLNEDLIKIEVDEEYKNVSFYNEIIKEKLVFNKYMRNPITNEVVKEANAKFSLYNFNNEQIATFTTDSNGTYEITLPYGNYILKQDYGMINHSYIKELTITVNSHGNTQYFDLYNDELTSLVKIINTDSDSNLPILEGGSTFKIKKVDTDTEIETLITNDLGITNSVLLSTGKYIVEQISSIYGYEINQNIFEFEIDENTNFSKENDSNLIEIAIPNNKLKSGVKVIKITEYYLNDILNDVKTEYLNNISIYANEDIYSKDGKKLYEENSIITTDLYLGNYYIINPINGDKIELVLNTPNTRKVEILEKIYEYEKQIPEKEEIIQNEEINNSEEPEITNEEIISDVPNTYQKKATSYISSFLILIGFIVNKRKKINESD